MLIIERFSSHRGVIFETLGDYVERWKDGNALDRWGPRTRCTRAGSRT